MTQYQLVMKKGPAPGKVYELTRNELHIGRDINHEIAINDAEISRRHCRLAAQGDGYILEDLGSTNGTFVNEQRVSGQVSLRPGDIIRVGDNVRLAYEIAGLDADATIASSGKQAPPPPTPPPQRPAPPPPPAQQHASQAPASPAPAQPKAKSNRNLMIGCGVLLVLGICVTIGLFYVDANCLWCEITWNLLPGCPVVCQ